MCSVPKGAVTRLTSAIKRRIDGLQNRRGGEPLRNSGRRRGGLFRKYALVFVGLVAGSLMVSDVIQAYLSYRDKNQSVQTATRDSPAAAAATLERFLTVATAEFAGMV